MTKNVCFFGSYNKNYSRNILVRKAFDKLGYKIIDCNDTKGGVKHYFNLIKAFLGEGKRGEFIFVGVLGHYDVPLAWILAKLFNKKIIFDAFYSLYDTYLEDRKLFNKKSLAAVRFYLYDFMSLILADKVLFDTTENINYVVNKYKVRRDKFYVLPVSVDEDIFRFLPTKKQDKLVVGFYGSFLPLHGVDNIIKATNILRKERNIRLIILGWGQTLKDISKQIKQLKLETKIELDTKLIPYEKLPEFYNKINLFLAGPFGNTGKAKRVITAKTAESLKVGKPTIIVRTPATEELTTVKLANIIWLKDNNPESIANGILDFKKNQDKYLTKKDKFDNTFLSFGNFTKRLEFILMS